MTRPDGAITRIWSLPVPGPGRRGAGHAHAATAVAVGHVQDEGCILVFTYAFTDRDQAALAAAGWDRCFAAFDAHLAGQSMSQASALTFWPEVHERYASIWGIDPEIGRAVYAEHSPA